MRFTFYLLLPPLLTSTFDLNKTLEPSQILLEDILLEEKVFLLEEFFLDI